MKSCAALELETRRIVGDPDELAQLLRIGAEKMEVGRMMYDGNEVAEALAIELEPPRFIRLSNAHTLDARIGSVDYTFRPTAYVTVANEVPLAENYKSSGGSKDTAK